MVTKTDIYAKLKDISDRVTENKSKDLLLDNELKKLRTFDTDYFEGKNYFEGGDGMQSTLVFRVKNEYFGHETISTIVTVLGSQKAFLIKLCTILKAL